jgi:hypothetical protein
VAVYPLIRTALANRLGDQIPDAHEEAVAGLARRRDPRATPYVAALFDMDDPPGWVFESAAALADPGLLPRLRRHSASDPQVADALLECDPEASAARDRFAEGTLAAIHRADPDSGAAVYSSTLGYGLELFFTDGVEDQVWAIAGLHYRADGDPDRAAEAVLNDLTAGPTIAVEQR